MCCGVMLLPLIMYIYYDTYDVQSDIRNTAYWSVINRTLNDTAKKRYNAPSLTSVDVVPLMKTAGVVENSGHCVFSIG